MKPLARWLRFNLVGALGALVQLASLAILRLWFARHYLLITLSAVELTLLHNFLWHLRYTWKDRISTTRTMPHLVRFHLSNGLVSITGNLALMRILVHSARMPLLAANTIAIACCSIANFCLADAWAFSSRAQPAVPTS